jgi:succinylglutamic semialdehyde dehydrogenase
VARRSSGPWWDQPLEARIAIAQRYAEVVKSRSDDLARLISREMGKALWESRGEASTVIAKIGLSVEALRARRDTTSFDLAGALATTRYKPHGVVAVLGPFNFPAHLPNGHIVPALLAGNTIVFKPSEQTPAVGAWMAQAWEEAGLPPGVLNLVQGGRPVGEAVAADPQSDGLLFTGSGGAGRALHRLFSRWPQKLLALEMGGNNALVVHRVRNLKAAAYHTLLSAFITSGQRCTCARRLIVVEDGQTGPLLEELRRLASQARFGRWDAEPQPFAGTVVNAESGNRILAAWHDQLAAGGQSLLAPQALDHNPALLTPGIVDMTNVAQRSDEEVFGPLLNVIRVPDFASAIAEANRSQYGLSAGLLSDDRAAWEQFVHEIRAGVVNWNRQTTGASGKLPFGGCGMSGNHRPAGYFSADYCSWPVASLEYGQLSIPETTEPGIVL